MTKNQKIDEEALAEAYNRALTLEKAGDVDAAVKAYQDVLAIDPEDHGGAAVRIAAMGRAKRRRKRPTPTSKPCSISTPRPSRIFLSNSLATPCR